LRCAVPVAATVALRIPKQQQQQQQLRWHQLMWRRKRQQVECCNRLKPS